MGNAPNRAGQATGTRTRTSCGDRSAGGVGSRHDDPARVCPASDTTSGGVPSSSIVSAFSPSVVVQTCVAVKAVAECGQCLEATEEKVAAAPRNVVLSERFFPLTIDVDRPNKFLFIANTYHDHQTRHRTALHDCANTVGALQSLLRPSTTGKHADSPERTSSTHWQGKDAIQRHATLENSSIAFAVNRPKARFLKEFEEFCECVQPGDSVCVYYAGLATQVSAQPCFVTPVSHTEAHETSGKPRNSIKRCTVNLVDMVDSVAARSPRMVCFILDCAADFDALNKRALPISVGLPMIYEFVGDKIIIMQSLAPGVSLPSELLSQRTASAEDCFPGSTFSAPREDMERYKGIEALSLPSTFHSPVRGRDVSRWDSEEGRIWLHRESVEENSNSDTTMRRESCDSPELQPLDQIEVPCDVNPRTPYESFFTHAKHACGPEELATIPRTWERCIEPCSNLSFCIIQASHSLAKGAGLDFLSMAQLISPLVNRVTSNKQAFCCLTNM